MSWRLEVTPRARRDLVAITRYIAKSSGDQARAARFARLVVDKCRRLASQPFELGRPRPALGEGIRSVPFGNYILILIYQRDALVIARIVEGHRDIDGGLGP